MTERDHYARRPYLGRVHNTAHIDRLATVAALFGLPAAHPARARVLEVGCADGTNLINMAAYLPGSVFVGIDFFEGHVETGRAQIAALGLDNVTIRSADIREPPPDLGDFDYIIAHGVYSWVSAETRDALLALIQARLRPQGMALVSYNTQPGWSFYLPLRGMMRWHTRDLVGATAEVAEGRAAIDLMRQAVTDPSHRQAKLLDDQIAELDSVSDDYIYHEYLEPENHPVWFHEFAAHVSRSGLQYVGEASFPSMLDDIFPPDVQQTLAGLSRTLEEQQQYRDFLTQRRFRSSLITHAERTIERTVSLQPLLALAAAVPLQITEDSPEALSLAHREHPSLAVSATDPIHRCALALLSARFPEALPFAEIVAHCAAALERVPDAPFQTALAEMLMTLYRKNGAELYTVPPPVVATAGEGVRVPPLVALQAERGAAVCSPRHEMFRLSDAERALLRHLAAGGAAEGADQAVLSSLLGRGLLSRSGPPRTSG